MKVRLNERQYNLIVEAESTEYGVEKLFSLAGVGEFIILNEAADLDTGGEIEFDVDDSTPKESDNSSKYKILQIVKESIKMVLQQTSSNRRFVIDFSKFDNGQLQTSEGKSFTINNVKLFKGGKPSITIKPKSHSQDHMDNQNNSEVDEKTKAFIDKLNDLKGQSEKNVSFIDSNGKEIKEFGISATKPKGSIYLIDLAAEETVRVPLDSVKYDSGTGTCSFKYYSGDRFSTPNTIEDVMKIDVIDSGSNRNDKSGDKDEENKDGEEGKESDEQKALQLILDELEDIPNGNLVKFDGYEFIVVKTFKDKNGEPSVTLKPKDSNSLKFLKDNLNEGDKEKLLDKYQFTIDINKVKLKGGKMNIPITIGGKQHNLTSSLSGYDTSNNEFGKDSEDKANKTNSKNKKEKEKEIEREKRRERERLDKDRKRNTKKAIELMKDNPRLIDGIKKGIVPAKDILSKIMDVASNYNSKDKKGDKKGEEWLSKFKSGVKVKFQLEYLEDKKIKKHLGLEDNNNVIKVEGKDSNKVILRNGSKDHKYKIFLGKKISDNEYSGTLRFTRPNGIDKDVKIELIINDYNAV